MSTSALKSALATGLLAYLDTLLVTIKEQLASGAKADEAVKTGCVVFLCVKDDLLDLVTKTSSSIDDQFLVEFDEAARKILPVELVAELDKLPI